MDAIARSTLARNHASCAAASSLVANSDSMGVRSVFGERNGSCELVERQEWCAGASTAIERLVNTILKFKVVLLSSERQS